MKYNTIIKQISAFKRSIKLCCFFVATLFTVASCDYLDIVPDDTATLADGFKNEQTAEGAVFSCYSYIPEANNARTNFAWLMSNEIVSSYHWSVQYFTYLQIQQGLYSASNPVLDIWRNSYEGIRQCYIFLENIESVKPVNISTEEFIQRKKQWIAEVKFLNAYFHYILLQNYGPIVIIDKLLPVDGLGDDFFRKRLSYDKCVEAIAQMFDDAIVDLPMSITSKGDFGRASKVIAQALKSRMYLFAASPLFNGNSEFYSGFKNKDGEQLINLTYDKEKWKKAMDETQKAIDMAHAAGYSLYQYRQKTTNDPFEQAVLNARYTMIDPWNSELIWGYTGQKENLGGGLSNSLQAHAIPIGFRTTLPPFGGAGPTLTAVEMFYSEKGVPANEDPDFDWEGRFTIASGDSTIKLHRNREPRFYAFIGFDRGPYELNGETVTLKLRAGEKNGMVNLNSDHLYGGYALKKGVSPDNNVTQTRFSLTTYPFPLMRLGELYLNYAEASANYSGRLDANATTYFNAIRAKAGLPTLAEAFGAPADNQLVQIVKRERMIEFMFEAHWLYDLKRWKEAEPFFAKDANGMRGLYSQGRTAETYYQDYTLIGRPLIFSRKQYLHPIRQSDIDVNHNLVQNPGW